MATSYLTRSLLTTAKQTLTSALSRSYNSLSLSIPPSSFSYSPYLFRLRPLVAVAANFPRLPPVSATVRGLATRQTSSSLNDPSPNWSNRPPKETILLDGCDFEHWLVVMEKPEGDPTRDEIIDSYIKTLAMVVGSEEEARMKIYSISTKHYFAFGALVSEELSYKIKELPRVRWVLPDSFLDVKNKDYGGEPFINGQAVPYDPKYHEEWVRNNARANERNRKNENRRTERSRNFERRRENQRGPGPMSNQNMQNPGPYMGPPPPGPPAGNMGYNPNIAGTPPNNIGNMQQNPGGPPNMGGMQSNNMRNMPPPHMGPMQPPPNMGGMPQNNMGGIPNNAANFRYGNGSGIPHQSGPGPNRDYQPNYSQNMAGNPYTTQNIPGSDVPPNNL